MNSLDHRVGIVTAVLSSSHSHTVISVDICELTLTWKQKKRKTSVFFLTVDWGVDEVNVPGTPTVSLRRRRSDQSHLYLSVCVCVGVCVCMYSCYDMNSSSVCSFPFFTWWVCFDYLLFFSRYHAHPASLPSYLSTAPFDMAWTNIARHILLWTF